jgi:hypothetical protein
MARPVGWAFVVGLVLFVAGLAVSTIAPSTPGEWLVIAGAVVMASGPWQSDGLADDRFPLGHDALPAGPGDG